MALAASAGVVRLLPWLLSPEVPWRVALPFAEALAAAAAETTLLIAIPLGFALGTAAYVGYGEARALAALGASPLRQTRAILLVALGFSGLSLGVSLLWDTDASAPGRIAQGLVAQARASCEHVTQPRAALVPMVGVTWTCFPNSTPHVVGALPGSNGQLWFSATELDASADLSTFQLRGLQLSTRGQGGWPPIRLRVGEASLRGLPSWGRPANLPAFWRAVLLSVTQLLAASSLTWLLIVRSISSRVGAILSGALPGLLTLVVLSRLDKTTTGLVAYVLLPALAAGSVIVLAPVIRACSVLGSRVRNARRLGQELRLREPSSS